ncbi:enoyl-CoA hydratase-related protein [Duganella sp. HH105]|uniref:enoyl-CoA hydratase-related protein n=1 Tax=Duganella sp. HH105 TaxID=1781067 RepID=UPI000877DE9A|nr:enoyl-CoA hydratase-related protein [Duganella sp. HH105]OEZ64172.1 fatty acid oxidation complex subunit alpha [Duganella sp. HH105]
MITTHQNGGAITVMLAARAINPLSRLFQRELAALIDILEAKRTTLHGVIIGFHAEPSDFDHELEHLMALTAAQAGDCMHMLGAYNALLRRLESLGIPVIATLGGAVSGHALGLALACHRRISLDDATFSLPQVQLGVAPVAGEIARTVRLAGLQAAMPLLLEGVTLSAEQALHAGLLHGMADNVEDAAELVRDAMDTDAIAAQPWDIKGYRLPGGALNSAPLQTLLQVAPAMLRERTGGHLPAPEAILCAMVEGLQVDFDSALLIESRYFCQTAITPVAYNLMRLSQLRANLAAPAALELAAALHTRYAEEVRALRAAAVPEALLRNAARAAGLPAPPDTAEDAVAAIENQDVPPLAFADIRDRLLYALSSTAQDQVESGAVSGDEADLISVRLFGFPAHTGGAIRFVQHIGAQRYAELVSGDPAPAIQRS